jgi:hypothetical protein
MGIPIPYALTYTATVEGRAPKLVQCEGCGHEYVYFLERTASGQGTSMLFLDNEGAQSTASAEAHAELMARLDKACEAVPCPACGRYQQHMVTYARHLRYRWMRTGAVLLFTLGALLFMGAMAFSPARGNPNDPDADLPATLLWGGVWMGFLGCPALLVLRYWLSKRYDPNREDLEERKQYGQRYSMSLPDFLKAVEANSAGQSP